MSDAPRKWMMVFDVALCTDCNNCTLATQDEYVGNDFPGYAASMPRHGHRWINIERKERGRMPMVDVAYLATMCQHCDDAPCLRAAKDGAVVKRPDGIVVIDPVRAKGQRAIVDACPYGAVWWNEEKQLPQHWNFDAHLIDGGWAAPRCVQACPTGAMESRKVTDEELAQMRRAEGLEDLRPDLATKPRILYRNLARFNAAFLGGSVASKENGIEDCVTGATVKLLCDGSEIARQETDAFGDFKFDGLAADGAFYRIEITAPGRPPQSVETPLAESLYLGVVYV